MTRLDYAREVKVALNDPKRLCQALGIAKGAEKQATGLLICCPAHGERHPSCSVTRAKDGTVRVKCFACDFSGDALHLIGQVKGLRTNDAGDFREILSWGARIAGLHSLEAEIRGDAPASETRHRPLPQPPPEPEREYPPQAEVKSLWDCAGPAADDRMASEYLVWRRICPVEASQRKLARVIVADQRTPSWARYRGMSWQKTGHRLILRVFDAVGRPRSVRAWRITDGDTPKRLPPGGYRASELVLANHAAWEMLSGRDTEPRTIVVVEGEPDFLTHATRTYDAVVGLMSGSWSSKFADAVPSGSEVVVRTHHDSAGDRYARIVTNSLAVRCAVWRSEP